jgi:ribonuclease P protein component
VGFVVSKAVGPAVTRNLVKRRLRHLCRERLPVLPSGSMLVVRALPAAASASYEELGRELDSSLAKVAVTKDVPAKAVIGR